MPATAERIEFVTKQWREAVSETPVIATRYGKLARVDEEPVETFFENVADAQIVADERQALLEAERRRFNVTAKGLDQALAMPMAGPQIPVTSYADPQRGIDRPVLVAEIAFDFASQKATYVVWG